MTVLPGFEVTLVASEPVVRQPVAIEFDDRGRLWVIQYLQYPNPAGLERVAVDRYSRTRYHRVPEPPPRGPVGADRVTILEDADGDGICERGRDFLSGLNLATGLAFGSGGVYVLQAPYLLFYADRDGDDAPDGDPLVELSGFGIEDAHSVANSLTWGPDGWLYGLQGSTVTARIRGLEFQQGVWRFHPRTREFELFSEGGGNLWGLDFDARGELFASTNVGGFTLLHAVQGAWFWKSFAKHGPLHNPFAFGHLDHVPCERFRGGHVAVGSLIYQGDAFPEEFRGAHLYGNLLSHDLYWQALEPRGSTFKAGEVRDLVRSNDTWFSPTDLTLGPDGAVYFADWHDERMAHPDPDAEWDRSNGRIFRLAPRGSPRAPARDASRGLGGKTSAELVRLLARRSVWYSGRARRLLAEREAARREPAILAELMGLARQGGEEAALRALWVLGASGILDEELALELLRHRHPSLRRWTVRFLGDGRRPSPRSAEALLERARVDLSPPVLSQLSSAAARMEPGLGLRIARALAAREETARDAHLPLLLWWAVEPHALPALDLTLELFASKAAFEVPLLSREVLPRLMKRFAGAGSVEGLSAVERLLERAPAAAARESLLAALAEALPAPGAGAAPPASLLRRLAEAFHERPDDPVRLRLAVLNGLEGAEAAALALARDRALDPEVRTRAVDLLADGATPSSAATLLALVSEAEPRPIQLGALRALSRLGEPSVAKDLLARAPGLSAEARVRVHEVLLGRREWALLLLERVERGEVPAAEVSLESLRLASLHQDSDLDRRIARRWGLVRPPTSEERLAEARRLGNDLRASSGDPAAGRILFARLCGSCHRLQGEGTPLGPDLTFANLKDTRWLLESLVDPSGLVRREFMSSIVETRDGRVLAGLVVEETPGAITIACASGERTAVRRADIASLRESAVSLMPEDLLKGLKAAELRDLFAYLQSAGPEPRAR